MRLALAILALAASPAWSQTVDPATADAVIARCVAIYQEPVNGKSHPCACDFNTAALGMTCGKRSAHESNRPRGARPICLRSEVTPEIAADYKTNQQAVLRGRCAYPR